jgi:ABC-2 type transport system permease protein
MASPSMLRAVQTVYKYVGSFLVWGVLNPVLTNRRFHRVLALLLRQYYLLRGSLVRTVEMFFWPVINLLVWGFLSRYLTQQPSSPTMIFVSLLAGAILWEVLLRSQFAVMMGTLEEMWSRNLAQLFIAPLRANDFLIAMMASGFLRTFMILGLCGLLAWGMFDFAIFDLSWNLLAFYGILLMTGWWCGIILSGLLLRYGLAVEWLAWMSGFLLQPLTAVFYPVSVLPNWLQPVAWALPPTYAFEGMRAVMQHGVMPMELLWQGFGLNLLYLLFACWFFHRAFDGARKHATFLQSGE